MNKPLLWRFGLTAVVLITALYSALPLEKKIKLGLDLQGGMYLVYEVETDKAIQLKLERLRNEIKDALENDGIGVGHMDTEGGNSLRVVLANPDDTVSAKRIFSEFSDLSEDSGQPQGELVYTFSEYKAKTLRQNSVDQALETLRNRIDAFGVSEPGIQRQGENRILIMLPGVQDPDRAKSLIKTTAMLEFKMVDEDASIEKAVAGDIPAGREVLWRYEIDPNTGKNEKRNAYVLMKNALLTGESIEDADVRIDQSYNEPYVLLVFDSEGGRRFAEITEKNVNKRFAIILDGKVHSAPVIQERIGGGRAQISGGFSTEEAHDLAIVLKAGALPAPLHLLEERTVGPTLGADSVAKGVKSIIFGLVTVILFMLAYYRIGGIIADFALILNLVVIAGIMGYLEATLTLPGIAGIILTVGMAVDANVLVFERIREEVANGKTIRAAVEAGFSKAFLTIIDANITTLIAAIVLFQFGTGPLKGFAVTLTIGILASMFTAVFVSRTVFNLILSSRKVTSVSI
ncbi:MAG: protein translocase subunit SecD [Nitrospinota bacterium]|nr:protein translocase subunit SecD [Nitrospinota bacterium]